MLRTLTGPFTLLGGDCAADRGLLLYRDECRCRGGGRKEGREGRREGRMRGWEGGKEGGEREAGREGGGGGCEGERKGVKIEWVASSFML